MVRSDFPSCYLFKQIYGQMPDPVCASCQGSFVEKVALLPLHLCLALIPNPL
jgi:hypothetical protein